MAIDVDKQGLLRLRDLPYVTSIEEREIGEPLLNFSVPWINGNDVHALGVGGTGYTIAIIDSGVQSDHPTLLNSSGTTRVVSEACYSEENIISIDTLCPNGSTSQTGTGSASPTSPGCLANSGDYDLNGTLCFHGTHVAGIAAGRDATYRGLAPEVNIIAIQTFYRENEILGVGCEDTGPCLHYDEADLITSLQRVYSLRTSNSIAAVNLSLGGGAYSSTCDSQKVNLYNAVNQLVGAGIAVIAASGNDSYSSQMRAPACLSNVVSVGATYSFSDDVTDYTNVASMLDLFAPGDDIRSSVPNSDWAPGDGTSMAAPHVAGAWALMRQIRPDATYSQILAAFMNTGQITGKDGIDRPRIDVLAAGQYLDSTPPSVPTLISPPNYSATNDTTPTLSWSSVSGAVLYDLEVATDTSFSDIIYISQGASTNETLPSLADDWYYWHVRARDLIGNWSSWSGYYAFKIDTVPPETPTLNSPPNNSVTNDATPTFDWGNSSGATSYNIQVDNSSGFSSPEINQTTTSSQYTPSTSLSDSLYYWRVMARDDVPNSSGWSSVWNVTIDTTPPSAPVLVLPANGSSTSNTTPTFEWAWPSGAVEFHIQIDTTNSFPSPDIDAYTTTGYYTPSPLATGIHYWRIQARDSANNWSSWSSVWSVTITPPLRAHSGNPVHPTDQPGSRPA